MESITPELLKATSQLGQGRQRWQALGRNSWQETPPAMVTTVGTTKQGTPWSRSRGSKPPAPQSVNHPTDYPIRAAITSYAARPQIVLQQRQRTHSSTTRPQPDGRLDTHTSNSNQSKCQTGPTTGHQQTPHH